MKCVRWLLTLSAGLALTWNGAWSAGSGPGPGYPPGQLPPCDCDTPVPGQLAPIPATSGTRPSSPTTPQTPGTEQTPQPETANQQDQAQNPEAGAGAEASANPQMFGDLIGMTGNQVITVPQGVTRVVRVVRVPIGSASAFKIAENESPRPQNRGFFTYNYFNNVNRSVNPPDFPSIDLHREVIGFEKTFWDGCASIGVRLPYFELVGSSAVDDSHLGDLSTIFKYAVINDRHSGDVVSIGVVVTVPTGRDFVTSTGDRIHDVLIQPFAGYIKNWSDFFVHGFVSLEVPSDPRDVVLLSNDIGIGYWLRKNDPEYFITSIVPTIELHVNDPLSHRGSQTLPIGVPDWVDVTAGLHLEFNRCWQLRTAVSTPITGPRPYEVEGIIQLNVLF